MSILVRLVLVFLLYGCTLQATTKTADEVFDKWVKYQNVFKDRSITKMSKNVGKKFWDQFVKDFEAEKQLLCPFVQPLNLLQLGHNKKLMLSGVTDNSQGSKLKQIDEKVRFKRRPFPSVYRWLDKDILAFLSFLQNSNFLSPAINKEEQGSDINYTIKRYNTFMKLFFSSVDKNLYAEYLFGVANRFFESWFDPKTFKSFYDKLTDSSLHQVGRLCYSTVWFHLVGDGWKSWHASCLGDLKREAKKGKEIVYVAGGNDIYQLLKYGIYRICVIDPLLPSQPDYYAGGWKWLSKGDDEKGGVGDEIKLDFGGKHKKLLLKRVSYNERGSFKAALSTGKTVTLPLSTTHWDVCSFDKKKKLGHVIFNRRFCNQQDFVVDASKALLLSFNEMYYVAAPPNISKWGIDIQKFSPDIKLYVKQLRKPITKPILENLRKNEKETKLNFIFLGSCAT